MKGFVVLIFVCALATVAAAQPRDAKYLLNVKGVGLGASYVQVIKAFGKPKKEETTDGDECRGGKQRMMEYDGLSFTLYLYDDDANAQYNVGWIEITSAKWLASGLKVGSTLSAVTNKLGQPTSKEPGRRREIHRNYNFAESDGPGNTMLTFRNGKLFKIQSFYIC